MFQNAYNLENYFFVREQKKKDRQKQNKTGKKRGEK